MGGYMQPTRNTPPKRQKPKRPLTSHTKTILHTIERRCTQPGHDSLLLSWLTVAGSLLPLWTGYFFAQGILRPPERGYPLAK